MRKLPYIFCSALLLLLLKTSFGQISSTGAETDASSDSLFVSGQVINVVNHTPVQGIYISYKTYGAAISDSTGHFRIAVPNEDVTLLIKGEGYNDKEVALKGRNSLEVKIQPSGGANIYGEILTTEGLSRRSQTTGATETISTNGAWNLSSGSADTYIQGRFAGLNAITRSGTYGVGADLFLRGFNSLYATNQPLIVVDGVYYDNGTYGTPLNNGYYNNPLTFIDLKDIDNITVVKDATATYGSKGANGAILITTARARKEATEINASLFGGVSFAPKNTPMMDAADFRSYLSEMLQSKGLSDADIAGLPFMNDSLSSMDYYSVHNDNNWQDKIFKNSHSENAYLKITGGDNIAKYALTIGYGKMNSPLTNTARERYNMRFNADLNLTKRLFATANISYYRNEQDLRNTGIAPTTNPISTALFKAPFFAQNVIAADGTVSPRLADYDTLGVSNPMAIINTANGANNSFRYSGAITLKYQLSDALSLATTVSITSQKIRETFFIPEQGISRDTLMNGVLAKNRSGAQVIKIFNIYNDTRLNYNRSFNHIHDLAFTLGMRYNNSKTEQDYGLGFNSATDQLTSVGYGLNTLRQIGGDIGSATWLESYLNASYGYMDKYYVTLSTSLDASSKFGRKVNNNAIRIADRPFGVFPSLGMSWLASSERFLSSAKWLDLLKVRASYGLSGNDDIGNFTARSYYTSRNLLGISGLVKGNIGNENLQWEKVSKLNAGVDLAMLGQRLNIKLDAYQNKTSNLILYEPGATITGQDYIIANDGAMKTTGVELDLSGVIVNTPKLKWSLGFNVSKYKSVMEKLPDGDILTQFADASILTRVSEAPNLFYGYKTEGVFVSDAAAAAAGLRNKNIDGSTTAFKGGDVIFKDLNGDKVIDGEDRTIIGDPNPDFIGGIYTNLQYRNWALDIYTSFTQGNDIYNYARRQLESESNFYNQTDAIRNRWRTEGQRTSIPKASFGDPLGNSRFSDRWIEDGSYFKLKTVSLSYNVPLKDGAIKAVNIYLTGSNLLTLTKYLGYDPEFSASSSVFGQGIDTFLEPQYKSVELGVRIGL